MDDANNDDITRFPFTTLGLCFHNPIVSLRYLTTGPEVGFFTRSSKGTLISPNL